MITYTLIERKSMTHVSRARTTTFSTVAAMGAIRSLIAQRLSITYSKTTDGSKTIEFQKGKTEHRFEGPADIINQILTELKVKEST